MLVDPRVSVALTFVVAVSAGCAVRSTGVVGAGPNTYMVSVQGRSSSTYGELRATALREATAHCAGLARELRVVSDTANAYVPFVRNPDVQLTF